MVSIEEWMTIIIQDVVQRKNDITNLTVFQIIFFIIKKRYINLIKVQK